MRDEIIRAVVKDAPIKAMAITGKDLVERARQIHQTLPVATAALGRTLMAASMMGSDIKAEDGSVTLKIDGKGPIGTILTVSDSQGNVRGYVQNPAVLLPSKRPGKLDVGRAVGTEGQLTVIKDLQMKEPYSGSVPLVSGEIAEDITAYFAESEQTPTACALGVLVNVDQSVLAAGGYLISLMPGVQEDAIARLEANVEQAGPVTTLIDSGMDAKAVLETILDGFQLEFTAPEPVEYRCYCSKERVERALISMGPEEMRKLIEEQGKAEITCQFCDVEYHFTEDDLLMLTENMGIGKNPAENEKM